MAWSAGVVAAFVIVASSWWGCARCVKSGSQPPAQVGQPVPDAGSGALPPQEASKGPTPRDATYRVGPGRKYTKLGQVAPLLRPGDVVVVDGDATYVEDLKLTEAGTADRKITLAGTRVNGKRPLLVGTVSALELAGDHYVVEGFEITGGSSRCVFHHADDITLRDTAVHDCPSHGVLGADDDTGSLTLDYVEVYRAGSGEMKHPIYVATDATAHPHSVFRMQHCYVHDGRGGNSVKSRAERNEIYYNWIEGASFDELGLYGPDGDDSDAARRDSDVVGNVIRKTGDGFYAARLGGDGSGESWGRYRFVNNTILLSAGAAGGIRITFGIDSLELYNNAFYRVSGGGITLIKDGGTWKRGRPLIAASHNLMPPGSTLTGPPRLFAALGSSPVVTDKPGFTNLASQDVRPEASSPLVRAGNIALRSPADHPFPAPLPAPLYLPPLHAIEAVGTAKRRPYTGRITIGAFECNAP